MLVQRQATFLYPVSYPPKVSNRVCFARIRTSNEYFLGDGGHFESVPAASNAPRRGVLARTTKAAASSPQQPTTWLAGCSSFDALSYKGKIVTQSGQSTHLVCTSSATKSAPGVFLFPSDSACMLLVALACMALSYLGRQNELTFLGAIS